MYDPKNVWPKKIFVWENRVRPKTNFVLKNFWSEKNSWSKKVFGLKKCLVRKTFYSEKDFGQKII